tara:strand:- start:453 stop:1058 length:606 start_codon:yes stop_codon:yes gene_type:complete
MSSIKLTADSGGGTFELKAPSSGSNARVLTVPDLADGTILTSSSGVGITMLDQFRVHSSFTGTVDPVQNWERTDDATDGFIGTGMTESSGIFTFPQTGIYLVEFQINWFFAGDEREVIAMFDISTNSGSNYDNVGLSRTHIKQCEGTNTHASCTASSTVDVTNASTFRCKGRTDTGGSSVYINGNSTGTETYFRFIRLGDT